jgi:hypothetical protein
MAIQNAIKLINAIDSDNGLRKSLYSLKKSADLEDFLNKNDLKFDMNEFEEAVNFLHVKCQFKEQADDLFQKVEWFRYIVASLKN